jgi:hypothetical protein
MRLRQYRTKTRGTLPEEPGILFEFLQTSRLYEAEEMTGF